MLYYIYIVYASPQPLFDFINVIIENYHLFQWLPVQGPHTSMAILLCGITKSSENVISDIVH